MTCFNKEHYKQLKRDCKQVGVHVYTTEEQYSTVHNGVSVAFGSTTDSQKGRMLEVAVSYCSPEDKYKRKHGKYQAMLHFSNGNTVQLPLNKELQALGSDKIGEYLTTDLFNL